MGQAQPESWYQEQTPLPVLRAYLGAFCIHGSVPRGFCSEIPFSKHFKILPKSFDFRLKCHDINSDSLRCLLTLHCELQGEGPSWTSSLTTMATTTSKRCHCLHLTEMRHKQDQSLAQGHTGIDAELGFILKVFS